MSDPATYALQAAVEEFGNLAQSEVAAAVATDASGNLFVEITDGSSDQGITMFDPSGTATSFAPKTAAVSSWSSLKVGPGGDIYAARTTRAIFKYDAAGGAAAALWQAFPIGSFITVMDFDQNQNIWAGGNNSSVYRVKQDKSIATFPFVANVRSVRVFNGVAAEKGILILMRTERSNGILPCISHVNLKKTDLRQRGCSKG